MRVYCRRRKNASIQLYVHYVLPTFHSRLAGGLASCVWFLRRFPTLVWLQVTCTLTLYLLPPYLYVTCRDSGQLHLHKEIIPGQVSPLQKLAGGSPFPTTTMGPVPALE